MAMTRKGAIDIMADRFVPILSYTGAVESCAASTSAGAGGTRRVQMTLTGCGRPLMGCQCTIEWPCVASLV
jgi:hypothetical protein